MITIIKTILGLTISDNEKEILEILNKSNIPRQVTGRGALTLDIKALYKSEKFKEYQKLSKDIITK